MEKAVNDVGGPLKGLLCVGQRLGLAPWMVTMSRLWMALLELGSSLVATLVTLA